MNQEVQKYYSNIPKQSQAQLESLRKIIASLLPSSTEEIHYGIPTFKIDGKSVVGIGGWNDFVSLYPYGSDLIVKYKADLATYKTSKGAIQFKLTETLPKALIKKIISDKLKTLS